jgi:hypothetical protein
VCRELRSSATLLRLTLKQGATIIRQYYRSKTDYATLLRLVVACADSETITVTWQVGMQLAPPLGTEFCAWRPCLASARRVHCRQREPAAELQDQKWRQLAERERIVREAEAAQQREAEARNARKAASRRWPRPRNER